MNQEVRDPPPLSVLLAEDNIVNQRVASALLEKIGHRVTICNNGLEAVKAVTDGAFDLVLMDIQMPVMDGLAAAVAIRALADPHKARIPILAISANVRESDIALYRSHGIDEVLTKPLRPEILHSLLRRCASASATPQTDSLLDETQIAALQEALPPQKLAELMAMARDSLLASQDALREGWRQGEPRQIAAAAHRLAGVARNFGCRALGQCAARIEESAKGGADGQGDRDDLERLLAASIEALAKLP